jgi:hypothetical protein
MLERLLEIRRAKPSFQVLFLRNDPSQEVEVHELEQVDFLTVQQRLEKGESVFITSKSSQKIAAPKPKKSRASGSPKTRVVTAFYLEPI